MRLFLILMSLLTLSVALGSTLVTIVAIGGATRTVESSIDGSIAQGQSALHGYVTVTILPQDSPLDEEIALVKGS